MPILVTGSAGFIGMHTVARLLEQGETVVGFDNRNDYYDPALKAARVAQNAGHPNYTEIEGDLADRKAIESLFTEHRPDRVIHLAAQAGVRYSLQNPYAYSDSNLIGFVNLLECCRHHAVAHLVFASSSSVYGANRRMPFSETDNVDHPISLYAATKKSNELLAHSYAHLYRIPTTGLRFFTVYGPWGRPDMAYFSFTQKILAGEPIELYNHGQMKRDFTYIDDVVEGVVRLADHPATPNPDWSGESPDPATSDAPRHRGRETLRRHPARRCRSHLGRHLRPRIRRRLPPHHHHRHRPPKVRRLVPRLPRHVSRLACKASQPARRRKAAASIYSFWLL